MTSDTLIRALDASDDDAIDLVAQRMRETLVEVLGPERGGTLYSTEWLVRRVKQHLDGESITGQVFLAQTPGAIAGHVIVRVDADDADNAIGLISTIFVAAEYRRSGIATALVARAERWMIEHHMPRSVTYTDRGNHRLHTLFLGLGYTLTPMENDFVALSKMLR